MLFLNVPRYYTTICSIVNQIKRKNYTKYSGYWEKPKKKETLRKPEKPVLKRSPPLLKNVKFMKKIKIVRKKIKTVRKNFHADEERLKAECGLA